MIIPGFQFRGFKTPYWIPRPTPPKSALTYDPKHKVIGPKFYSMYSELWHVHPCWKGYQDQF